MKHKIANLTQTDELIIEMGDYITINLDINLHNTTINNIKIDLHVLKKYLENQFVEFLNLTRKQQLLERSANS